MHSSRGGFYGERRDHDRGGGWHGRGHHGGRGRGSHRSRGRGFGSSGDGGPSRFKKSYSEEVRDQVDTLYNKKFKFVDEYSQWKLPDVANWFSTSEVNPLQLAKFVETKEQLNDLRSNLDDIELSSWSRHTHFTNRSGIVVSALRRDFEPEMCTQGWTKLHEILWTFKNVVPESGLLFNSVHLCEAPGAFVASLNHFLGTHRKDCSWKWKAFTLNPYYEGNSYLSLIDQDKFISETKENWCMGADDTGEMTTWENFEKLKAEVEEELEDVHLVTADGSMDCTRTPEKQESMVYHLLFCETVAALLLLKPKGNFILKTFTTLEPRTVALMYLLVCCFSEVNVFKPATSKSGNSEQYVICIEYKDLLTQKHLEELELVYCSTPHNETIFPIVDIPSSFLTQLHHCSAKFAKYQSDAISENMRLYECMRASEKQFITEVKELTCDTFKTRFKLKSMPRDKNIVPHIHLNGTLLNLMAFVQGDPTREWLGRRSIKDFLSRLEERKKEREGEDSPKEEGEEEGEEEEGMPVKKRLKLGLSEDVRAAVQHLLNVVGYEGKVADRVAELPHVLMETDPEDIQWLKNNNPSDVANNLKSKDGRMVVTVTNSRFCRHDLLNKLTETVKLAQIMQADHAAEYKSIASHVSPGHALSMRPLPFYFNNDAVNMAALDYLISFMEKDEEMLFLDLAGAPSGFSHYIYWKKQESVKGWGMVRVEKPSLGPGKIIEQLAPWETFQVLGPHSGVDICDSVMIKSLCAGIKNYCPDGIHLVIGDVPSVPFGAHPSGYCELHSKRYLLAQLICACKILRPGGIFICRTYELLTRFSAGLLYIMYKLFEEVTIVKPMTSSPVSAERFIIGRGFTSCKSILAQLLLDMNTHISELRKQEEVDLLEVIPIQYIFDEQFHRFLSQSNERIAKYRIRMISTLQGYLEDPEKLPFPEGKELLVKGILQVLQLPENPF